MLEIPCRKSNSLLINCCILVFISMQYAVPWDLHQGLAFINLNVIWIIKRSTPGPLPLCFPSVPSPRCLQDPAPQPGHRLGLCLRPGQAPAPRVCPSEPRKALSHLPSWRGASTRAGLCLISRHYRPYGGEQDLPDCSPLPPFYPISTAPRGRGCDYPLPQPQIFPLSSQLASKAKFTSAGIASRLDRHALSYSHEAGTAPH